MTEGEARAWVRDRFGTDGLESMAMLVAAVCEEAARQNLIASSTIPSIWARHIVDSAQLIRLAPASNGHWLDIGSGAGFPGLVVAGLTLRHVTLVEPRKRRAEFLGRCANLMRIADWVDVRRNKVADVAVTSHVISARAVAHVSTLFNQAQQCSTWNTVWILPKGKTAGEEVEIAKRSWQGEFHVEQSITDSTSKIIVARHVRPR